jgi:Family of unknown function (DUF6800)
MARSRRTELHRRRVRRKRLAKVRDRYSRAETEADRTALLEKIAKVAPGMASMLHAGDRAVEEVPTRPVDTAVKKGARSARRGARESAAAAESKDAQSLEGCG